ncbi:unnamed protein product, partial [Sphacelaria rigidula]
GIYQRRKSRALAVGIHVPSTGVRDPILGLCPALEARISDLRGDNTAVAQFLAKAQAAAWHRARQPAKELIVRNRAMCVLEDTQFSVVRREELATRAQRRREANRERKRRMDRRRDAIAEAARKKREGPSLAEARTQQQSEDLTRRQRFFLTAVVAVNSAVEWRGFWKSRKWMLDKLAAAMSGGDGEKVTERVLSELEVSAIKVQRFIRKRHGRSFTGDTGAEGGVVGSESSNNKVRLLKKWIPKAAESWKRRRHVGVRVIFAFLKDAKLTQNILAIYRFRRRVIR